MYNNVRAWVLANRLATVALIALVVALVWGYNRNYEPIKLAEAPPVSIPVLVPVPVPTAGVQQPKPPTKNGEVFQYETTAALMSGKDCGQKDYCVEVPFQSYWVKGKDGVTYNFRDCTDTPNAGNGKVVTCQQVGGGREKMKFAHDNTGNLRDVRVIR